MQSAILKHLCVLVLASLVIGLATPLRAAQASPDGGAVQVPADADNQAPLCNADMIDTVFAFRDQPVGEQAISLYFLNKGKAACRLKNPPNPSFAVDGHSMTVGSCAFCDADGKPNPMWDRRPENQVVLEPGATATIDVNWSSTGESCQWADWASIFFNWIEVYDWRKLTQFLFIPSGWPIHICSPVRSFGYRIAADSPFAEGKKGPALRVSLLQESVYSDERATLHVELATAAQSGEKPGGCATLYVVRHSSSETRFERLATLGSSQTDSYTPEQIREDKERAWPEWRNDRKRPCDIAGGATSADAEIEASALATVTHIEWRTASAPGTEPAFLSVPTHFEVRDVDTLAPNWGETVKGIRAGLSLDREKFTVGERVPLHLRWENVAASVSLGETECSYSEPQLEIQDSQHHVLKTVPADSLCMGHAWGPFEIAKGKPQHIFRELRTASDPKPYFVTRALWTLPEPGVYYLVSVWSARVLDKINIEPAAVPARGGGKLGAVYANARSTPVRIEVVPRDDSQKKVGP